MAVSDLPAAVQAITEAVRAAAGNPADAIRCLTNLAAFYPTIPPPLSPQSIAAAQTIIAVAALCRQAVLASLALACAAYQPTSYDDAASVQAAVLPLFDAEITAVADAEQDASFLALRQLRSAVALDLATRGALLPRLLMVTTRASVSSLEIAYRLYGDASRADEVAARANCQHPGFLPNSMLLLAR